jgi:RNA polymerase primary sigma factor
MMESHRTQHDDLQHGGTATPVLPGSHDAEEAGEDDYGLGSTPAELRDPLVLYVRRMSGGHLLTLEDERRLARLKDEGDEDAKRELVESNLRLVMWIARSYRSTRVPLIDLIQEGNLGLLRAVDRFDYRRGFRLSTYAVWWIRQAIARALVEQGRTIRLPLHVAADARAVRRAQFGLAESLGRNPTPAEIALETGLHPRRVERLIEIIDEPLSLDAPFGDDAGHLGDVLEGEHDGSLTLAVDDERREALLQALEFLTPQMRLVLTLRFGLHGREPATLAQIGASLGVSRERARQVEQKALIRLESIAPHLRAHLDG